MNIFERHIPFKLRTRLLFALILLFATPIAHALDTILIIRPAGPHFEQIVSGIADETEGEIAYQELVIDKTATVKEMYLSIMTHQPKALVLMGNQQMNLFKQLQHSHSQETFPPVVAVAALFIDRVMADSKNVTGILYEVPAVTGLISLRNISKQNIKRVGVLHREDMADMIAINKQYCAAEGIELVTLSISNEAAKDAWKTSKALKKLGRQSLDAIWISNDSGLLTKKLVIKSWMPFMARFKKPVLVGVETLIKSKLNMGTLAVFPDFSDLGVQTAGIIFELMENNWQMEERGFDQPISVMKHLNVYISKKREIKLHQDRLSQIDKIIK